MHTLHESRLRGKIHDSNSACHEALQKHFMAAYQLTSRKMGQFVEQLIINEVVARLLANTETEEEDENDGLGGGGDDEEDQYDSTAPRLNLQRSRLQQRRRYSRKKSVPKLGASRGITGWAAALHRRAESDQSLGLPVLDEALSCDDTTPFCSSNTLYHIRLSYPRFGRMQYTVRCAPSFLGTPSFDWLRYRGRDGVLRDGHAVVVLNTSARGWHPLVVKRSDKAVSLPECVLTKYGCEPLK